MPPIGETLREARMRQRLDIADVEERTKIRAKYLRALENEEWGLLPGPTFVKTFLRTYAEVVGVDPYLLVEEYRLTEEHTDAPEFQALAPMQPRDRGRDRGRGARRPPKRPRPRGGLIAGAVLVVVVGFLLVLGLTGGDDDPGGGGGEQAATTQTTTTKRPARPRQRQKQPAPTGVNVRIAPVEPTYVCVDNGPDTAVVFENTLDAPRTFRNSRQVRINLGKRSAVVSLNGEQVTVQQSAEPIALELNRDGTSELDSAEAPCA
ncbi:MAG TPA: helix-turn-helix domain-containing protein [Thermoleophilaceae bacterium]|nr:helix-turn-helix domain-containing protein [Thermoleophilaceae bacterium]